MRQSVIGLSAAACRPGRARPWRIRGARVLAALLAAAAIRAAAQSVEYRVEIDAPEPLAELLRANLDLVRWSGRADVSEDQLKLLVKSAPRQARDLLATEGYFSPLVSVELARQQAAWVARLKVEPGEPARVISVDFRVSGAIDSDPHREERIAAARQAFGIEPGRIFRQAHWEAGKERALHSLQRRLYAAAAMAHSRADIDPRTREARLQVAIDSGPPFAFGALEIRGLQRYAPSIVHNLSPIRAGDPYDEEELLKFQRRLLGSGYFASAVVSAGNDPAQAAAAPVYVTLVESAARRLELGAGFSTDRGARFQAGYTDHNALGRAWRFNSVLKLDRVSQQAAGGLTLPRDEKGWRNGFEGKVNHQDIQGEERLDWSVAAARTYSIETRESQLALEYLSEKQVLESGEEDYRKALYLSRSWSWSALDDALAPRQGYTLRLAGGAAGQAALSDQNFARLQVKGTYLQPVRGFGTLLVRLELGYVAADSRAGIPSAYLFRTGGDTTVRGYAFESLGVQENGAVTGGRYLGVGSVEYIQWIAPRWGLAAFYDAGNATDELSGFRAAAGYGAGVRWSSPVGTLSLDLAYGERSEQYRVHFNVGLVF